MTGAGEPIVDRWRDGDARCHCTHCEACGRLFRTTELPMHLAQAHLGGKAIHDLHRQAGCDMLVSLVTTGKGHDRLDAWVAIEIRIRDVRAWIERTP